MADDLSAPNFRNGATEENPAWRERVQEFLRSFDRHDLASLLAYADYTPGSEDWFDAEVPAALISAPEPFATALSGLSNQDKNRICEALSATDDRIRSSACLRRLVITTSKDSLPAEATLLPDLLVEQSQLVSVATGGSRIQDVDDYYRARRKRINKALTERGLTDPNPFVNLWDWYHKWRADFPTWAERRRYIHNLFAPTLAVIQQPQSESTIAKREPTGWERVDRAVAKARSQFDKSQHEEDYQTVGLLCREVLISLGQAVFDPSKHQTGDGIEPSSTDGKRMLDAFLLSAVAGSSNEAHRKHAKAGLALAVELQHRRTATAIDAELCIEATSSIVNVISILARRNA
jgi:hypothetical protein